MTDQNYVHSQTNGSRTAQHRYQQMSRVAHQTTHRPLSFQSSPISPNRQPGVGGQGHSLPLSQQQDQLHRRSREHRRTSRSRSSHGRRRQSVQRRRSAQHARLWDDIKHLIKCLILGRDAVEAKLTKKTSHKDMREAKARAERAANPAPIATPINLQSPETVTASVRPPQPAITRRAWEATPMMFPKVSRKPVPKPSPGLPVKIVDAPNHQQSVRVVKQMPSNASSTRSDRLSPKPPADRMQSCITQIGDFMIGSEEFERAAPTPPPKDSRFSQASSPNPGPCQICGAPSGPGFALNFHNLWLCQQCRHPDGFFEEPGPNTPGPSTAPIPRPAPTHSRFPSQESTPMRKSVLTRTRSPLSMLSGSRRGSDVSALSENQCFWDDGQVSPLSTIAPLRTKSARTPTPQEKGKQNVPRLPPLSFSDSMSPLIGPQPRATSSVYPEDELPAMPDIDDFPLPPIPAKFRDEHQRGGKHSQHYHRELRRSLAVEHRHQECLLKLRRGGLSLGDR